MKVFSTRSCEHLIKQMRVDKGKAVFKKFTDGELYVRIEDEDITNQDVWLLAATPAPAENIMELFFMLDALSRLGAKVHLLMSYFGYARQDRAESGEALSAQVLFTCLRQFSYTLEQTIILHIHNPHLRKFFDFEDLILLDFFLPLIEKVDCIVAPDQGARALVQALAQKTGKDVFVMKKVRSEQEHIQTVTFEGDVYNKNVLIVDDMITTGGTISKAATVLKQKGASNIYAAATHGIFSSHACQIVQESPLLKIFVTNSLAQRHEDPMIEVIDCAPMLEHIILSSVL
jgi:ribose-phosphate pyrophosphokinase